MKTVAVIALGSALVAFSQPAVADAFLKGGTEIKLTLLMDLSSGGTRLNTMVPFAVSEDVKDDDGNVLITSGTLAIGKVSQVRREGAFSAPVFDRPARLAITMQKTWAVDDQVINLRANLDKKPYELYQFNRDNTAIPDADKRKLDDAWKVKKKYDLLNRLVGIIKGGGKAEDFKDRAEQSLLSEIADSFSLGNTAELILGGHFNSIHDVVSALRDGKVLSSVLGIRSGIFAYKTAVKAVQEIAHLSKNVGNYLGGRFKGRNIRAPAGLEISCFASQDLRVEID